MKIALSISLVAVMAVAHGQYVVAPNAYATTPASQHGISTFLGSSSSPQTGQMLLNANQLTGVGVGSLITGLTFRLYTKTSASSPFPSKSATWANYDISIGQSVAPLDASADGTFADNFIGTPTLVRSGSLTLSAGSFTANGVATAANPWGYEIKFQTPYTYTGGNLGIQISQSGSSISTSGLLEAAMTSDAGYTAGDYSFYYASGYQTTTGGSRDILPVTRLSVTPVPEPSSLAFFGLGAIALIRRRRQIR